VDEPPSIAQGGKGVVVRGLSYFRRKFGSVRNGRGSHRCPLLYNVD
jgi:hypothetical protein